MPKHGELDFHLRKLEKHCRQYKHAQRYENRWLRKSSLEDVLRHAVKVIELGVEEYKKSYVK